MFVWKKWLRQRPSNSPCGATVRLALAAGVLMIATAATAEENAARNGGPVCDDDVWVISTRGVPCARQPQLHFWRNEHGCWRPSSREEFLGTAQPHAPTMFWVHGWRITHQRAVSSGWRVYRQMKCQAQRPFRFVIWSWPSQQTKGILQDAKEKAYLSDLGAYPLAWLVDQIDPTVPVGLVGFSYGARMNAGALHLLGGGCLVGKSLPARVHPVRAPIRTVMLAGAMDNCALAMGQRNGLAISQADRILIMVNRNDPVLKWYKLLYGLFGYRPDAMGYTGAAGNHGPEYFKVHQLEVSHIVMGQHHWDPYFCNGCLAATIARVALFADLAEPKVILPQTVTNQNNRSDE